MASPAATLSTARRAVRFFGTVHAQVDAMQSRVHAVRRRGATLLTPERFPAVLAATCVAGLIVGWQIMDRIYSAAVCVTMENLPILWAVCRRRVPLTFSVLFDSTRACHRNKNTWKSMSEIIQNYSTIEPGPCNAVVIRLLLR